MLMMMIGKGSHAGFDGKLPPHDAHLWSVWPYPSLHHYISTIAISLYLYITISLYHYITDHCCCQNIQKENKATGVVITDKPDCRGTSISALIYNGWTERGSGKKYDSPTSQNFIYGCLTRGIMGYIHYSKRCETCEVAERTNMEAPEHNCSRQFHKKICPSPWSPLRQLPTLSACFAYPGETAFLVSLVDKWQTTTCQHTRANMKWSQADYHSRKPEFVYPRYLNKKRNIRNTHTNWEHQRRQTQWETPIWRWQTWRATCWPQPPRPCFGKHVVSFAGEQVYPHRA